MIALTKSKDYTTAYLQEYICDTVDDIAELPTEKITPGSSCLVISTAEVYMLSPSRVWKKLGGGE